MESATTTSPPPQRIGFFPYLRLKLIVSLTRLIATLKGRRGWQRDKLLASHLGIRTERIRIPSRDLNRFINADLYHPAASSSPRPVLVNFHGSGFVFPGHGTDALLCTRVARELDVFVLDVDYRKAPETCFPGALHDVEDALRWTAAQKARFDPERVAVSGSSSGATLALVAATALRDTLSHLLSIVAVASIYPGTDLYSPPESKQAPKVNGPVLPPKMAHIFYDSYVPDKASRCDARISPAFADPASFPPTAIFITCDGDVFAPEGVELAAKIEKTGKSRVVMRMLEGVPHGFDKGCEEGSLAWTRREEAYGLVVESLRSAWKL